MELPSFGREGGRRRGKHETHCNLNSGVSPRLFEFYSPAPRTWKIYFLKVF